MAITVEEARALLAKLATDAVAERRDATRARLEKDLAGALGAYDALPKDAGREERIAALKAISAAADALDAFDAETGAAKVTR